MNDRNQFEQTETITQGPLAGFDITVHCGLGAMSLKDIQGLQKQDTAKQEASQTDSLLLLGQFGAAAIRESRKDQLNFDDLFVGF
jgi:hypothetical protein